MESANTQTTQTTQTTPAANAEFDINFLLALLTTGFMLWIEPSMRDWTQALWITVGAYLVLRVLNPAKSKKQ